MPSGGGGRRQVGRVLGQGRVTTKLRILAIEGAPAGAAQGLFDVDGDGEPGFDASGAAEHLRAVDPILARTIDLIGPFELQVAPTSSAFVALAEAIVYQQLHAKAAATIFGRVRALFPRTRNGPRPSRSCGRTDEQLRGAGLSQAKVLALRDLAERLPRRGDPDPRPPRPHGRRRDHRAADAVRGIGRWTAEMFLIFRLGRPDVLPVDDYGVRKGFALALGWRPPSPKELAAHGERWRPYRSVASWYLWRLLDVTRNAASRWRSNAASWDGPYRAAHQERWRMVTEQAASSRPMTPPPFSWSAIRASSTWRSPASPRSWVTSS